MNDEKLLTMIKEESEQEARPDFDDLLRRIESTEDGQEDIIEELPFPDRRARYTKYIALAASLAVVVSVAVIAVAGLTGSVTADTAENSIAFDSEISTEHENWAASYSDAESLPAVPPSDASASDAVSDSDTTALYRHDIPTLGLRIDLPSDAHITGRTVDAAFPPLEVFDMTAAELEVNYKTRNIYYNAVWFEGGADMTEILIAMTSDAQSYEIFNLSNVSDYSLERLEELYYSYKTVNNAVFDHVSLHRTEQAVFIRAEGHITRGDSRENHLQYMTIINGSCYEITLIEHYGLLSPMPENVPEAISQKSAGLMERVIDSVRFDRVKNEFFAKNSSSMILLVLIIIGGGAMLASYLYEKRRAKAAGAGSVKNASSKETEIFADDIPNEPNAEEDTDEEETQ